MTTWIPGDRVIHHHAMLDRDIPSYVRKVTQRHVVIESIEYIPNVMQVRTFTHKQADERLTRVQ